MEDEIVQCIEAGIDKLREEMYKFAASQKESQDELQHVLHNIDEAFLDATYGIWNELDRDE